MDSILLVSRILVGSYFLMSAWGHFVHLDMLASYTGSKGIMWPRVAVVVSGLLLFVGGSGILSGAYVPIAIASLVLFLIPVSFTMHAYWKDTDQMTRMNNRINFMKNMGLLGGVLAYLAIPLPWSFTLGV